MKLEYNALIFDIIDANVEIEETLKDMAQLVKEDKDPRIMQAYITIYNALVFMKNAKHAIKAVRNEKRKEATQ